MCHEVHFPIINSWNNSDIRLYVYYQMKEPSLIYLQFKLIIYKMLDFFIVQPTLISNIQILFCEKFKYYLDPYVWVCLFLFIFKLLWHWVHLFYFSKTYFHLIKIVCIVFFSIGIFENSNIFFTVCSWDLNHQFSLLFPQDQGWNFKKVLNLQ